MKKALEEAEKITEMVKEEIKIEKEEQEQKQEQEQALPLIKIGDDLPPPMKLEIEPEDHEAFRLKKMDLVEMTDNSDNSDTLIVVLPVLIVTFALILIVCSYLQCRKKFKAADGILDLEEPKITEQGLSAKKAQDEVFDIPQQEAADLQTLNPYPENEAQ